MMESRATHPPAAVKPINDRGFALLSTLLVLAVVGGVVLDQALRARVERRIAMNVVSDVRARAAAHAGIEQLVSRLRALQSLVDGENPFDPTLTATWNRIDAIAADLVDVAFEGGARYTVQLSDAASRLSLNACSEEELRNLFLALGATAYAAQAILNWRDTADPHRPRGAEWDDYYRRLPETLRPRNGPIQSVGEVARIRGVERLYAAAAPHLTVASGGSVNLNTATEPVLRSLPGLTDEAVAVILSRRATGELFRSLFELETGLSAPSRQRLQQEFGSLVPRIVFEPQILELMAIARIDGSPIHRIVEVVAVRSGGSVEIVRSTER